jgi:uncharacterized membrane protein
VSIAIARKPKLFARGGVLRRVWSVVARARRALFLTVMAVGSLLITASSLAYFDPDTLPPFVIEKLPVRFEALWLASLRVHVAAASVALPLCIVLMTRAIQRRAAWHRLLGRIAGVIVLFALVPSGVVLAFDAKGGSVVTAGFLLSAGFVAWFMASGVVAARRRDFVAHRRAMLHVFAQMSVAVTSRALLIGLDVAGMAPELAYVVALWGPVLGSAAVAEWMSVRSKSSAGARKVERVAHGVRKMSLSLRVRSLVRPLARIGR